MSPQTVSWFLIAASVLAEVLGTIALRYADGFTRPLPSLTVVLSYSAAIWLMSLAVRHLEVGLTYAVWAGTGMALTAVIGILWFAESASFLRVSGLVTIILGVILLNLSTH